MQIRGSISWSGSSPVKLPTSIPTLNTTFTSSYYCALKNTSTSSPKYRGLYHDSLILNQLVCLMTISFSSHLCNFARFPSFIAVLLAWNPNSESIELGYLFYLYEWKKKHHFVLAPRWTLEVYNYFRGTMQSTGEPWLVISISEKPTEHPEGKQFGEVCAWFFFSFQKS